MMHRLFESARAKVNLTLRVLGRRADGYHALESLVVFADDAADHLTFEPGAAPEVMMAGEFGASIAGANLLDAVLAAVASLHPDIALGRVTLEKNLPIAAGIGGGSADAAALLRLIGRANPTDTAGLDWLGLCQSLGADVPVCFRGEPTLMWSTGERFVRVGALPVLQAVLANPQTPVPIDKTAQVFRRLGAAPLTKKPQPPAPPPEFADAAGCIAWLSQRSNDLEAPALAVVPEIAVVTAALTASPGCRLARLSGGGPTCFGLFGTEVEAVSAARAIARAYPKWWVKATRLGP